MRRSQGVYEACAILFQKGASGNLPEKPADVP
jgi:hypothetical protein